MRNIVSAIGMACVLGAIVGAQSSDGRMAKAHDMGTAKDVTYTGCVEAGMAGSKTFSLTHATMADDKNDTMKDGAGKMADHDMGMGGMQAIAITSKSVDLTKHVGEKVTVTGPESHDMMDGAAAGATTVTVKTLKRIAKSCS
ncbi:MAG TPA: hypothetical protein VLT86_04105 [Vicinamibacterales bacterium]|nr:hypothetical protein [Vicinamibacterales bacterium]